MNITELTVHELLEKLKNKELTSTEITKAYVDRISEKEKDVLAFITPLTDEAIKKAEEGLVDYYTYQIKANKSKVDFLVNKARAKGLSLNMIEEIYFKKNQVG